MTEDRVVLLTIYEGMTCAAATKVLAACPPGSSLVGREDGTVDVVKRRGTKDEGDD